MQNNYTITCWDVNIQQVQRVQFKGCFRRCQDEVCVHCLQEGLGVLVMGAEVTNGRLGPGDLSQWWHTLAATILGANKRNSAPPASPQGSPLVKEIPVFWALPKWAGG